MPEKYVNEENIPSDDRCLPTMLSITFCESIVGDVLERRAVEPIKPLAIETSREESATSRKYKKNCKPKIRKRDLGNEEVFEKKNRKPSAGLLEHAVVT